MMTRLSGTVAGSSIPVSRRMTSANTASPMTNTSLPSAPVCHPITLVVGPGPEPTYQSVNAEMARIRPDTQVSRIPRPERSSKERAGLGCEASQSSSGSGGG